MQAVSAARQPGQQLKVMIAGAPAAGKGTQCVNIVEKYGLVHISVGDLLRDEVKAGSPEGKKAKVGRGGTTVAPPRAFAPFK